MNNKLGRVKVKWRGRLTVSFIQVLSRTEGDDFCGLPQCNSRWIPVLFVSRKTKLMEISNYYCSSFTIRPLGSLSLSAVRFVSVDYDNDATRLLIPRRSSSCKIIVIICFECCAHRMIST